MLGSNIHQTTLNGHKVIISNKDDIHTIFFDNGICAFDISGNCDINILKEAAESVIAQFD